VLVSLATELLHKLQFRHNQSQLEELDDDALDDDVCLPLVVSIKVVYPVPVTGTRSTWIVYRQSAINNLLAPETTPKPNPNLTITVLDGNYSFNLRN